MNKIFSRSKDKTMVKLGTADTKTESKWYLLGEKVKAFLDRLPSVNGLDVDDFKASEVKGEKLEVISYLTLSRKSGAGKGNYQSKGSSQGYQKYGKTPEEQEAIRRQAVGHDVATVLSGMKLSNMKEIAETATTLYAIFEKLTRVPSNNIDTVKEKEEVTEENKYDDIELDTEIF